MKYNTQNLKEIPTDVTFYLRSSATYTFILIKKNKEIDFANTATGKDMLLANKVVGDVLLMTWTGRYKSDVFIIEDKDLDKHYPDSINPRKKRKDAKK